MSLYSELKRRNVFRVALAYLAAAWLITEVSETLFTLFGYGDTPARFVVILLAIGLPIFLIFSWVFEITPEGLKLERDVVREESITPQTSKRIDRLIIVLLALALGYFAIDKWALEPGRVLEIVEETAKQARSEALVESYGEQSIAVLPFVNMSADPEQEYFSDGISEELLNLLSKIPEFRVISRSSAFSFKGKDVAIPDIAKQLNVAHILEGSVRKFGDQVRITVQLIEARSDTHLWSETYDRTMNDLFAIQDEIAVAVVNELKLALLSIPSAQEEVDPEAYTLVLHARHLYDQGTSESLEKAISLLKETLVIDPQYARAWTELARAYHRQIFFDQRTIENSKSLANEAINRALLIKPDYAPAHQLMAELTIAFDSDLAAAALHYQRALECDPSDNSFVATFLFHLGRLDEAVIFQERNILHDPLYSRGHYNLGVFYGQLGFLEKALSSFRTTIRLTPKFSGAYFKIGLTLLRKDQPQAALAAMKKEKDEIDRVKGIALASNSLGQAVEFETAFSELQERWGNTWPSEIAVVYAWIGNKDSAFSWLEREIEVNGTYGWSQVPKDPQFQSLHEDPRWQKLLERVGLSEKQLEAVEFAVDLPGDLGSE